MREFRNLVVVLLFVAMPPAAAISMALVDGDQMVWADGFGFRDSKKEIPATAETVYRVGSVSKLFTDIAVVQLAEEGS